MYLCSVCIVHTCICIMIYVRMSLGLGGAGAGVGCGKDVAFRMHKYQ